MHPILKVSKVNTSFKKSFRSEIQALDGIDFTMREGQNLGVVGEIGSGKSTLARLITNLGMISEGKISFYYKNRLENIYNIPDKYFRRHLQLVFQNCGLALNPRLKIYQNLEEVYRINFKRKVLIDDIYALIDELALGKDVLFKYPSDLSGGTQRRVFLARALAALEYLPGKNPYVNNHQADSYPKVLILDELTRSLDAPLQHKIINFLAEVQHRLNLTYLIISHDLKIICTLCKQVLVLHRGRLVEQMSTDCLKEEKREVFHPYTKLLLEDGMKIGNSGIREKVNGNFSHVDAGCHYRRFCAKQIDLCSRDRPSLTPVGQAKGEHLVACHRVGDNAI